MLSITTLQKISMNKQLLNLMIVKIETYKNMVQILHTVVEE